MHRMQPTCLSRSAAKLGLRNPLEHTCADGKERVAGPQPDSVIGGGWDLHALDTGDPSFGEPAGFCELVLRFGSGATMRRAQCSNASARSGWISDGRICSPNEGANLRSLNKRAGSVLHHAGDAALVNLGVYRGGNNETATSASTCPETQRPIISRRIRLL